MDYLTPSVMAEAVAVTTYLSILSTLAIIALTRKS
jgi:hypothetical protein